MLPGASIASWPFRQSQFPRKTVSDNLCTVAQVIWVEPALRELNEPAKIIALDKPEAAARLVGRVFFHSKMLVNQPELEQASRTSVIGGGHSHCVIEFR